MKLFTRADEHLLKKTIHIYKQELVGERKAFVLTSIFIPLQHFLYMVLLPLFISFFTQNLITHPQELSQQYWLLSAMAVVCILAIIAGRIGFIALFTHEERMTTKLAKRALDGLLAHSHSFFANSKVGSLAGDVNTFSRSYLQVMDAVFLQASNMAVNFVMSLIIIAFIAPMMLPVLALLTYVMIWDALRSYANRSTYRNQRKDMMSKLFGNIADTLGNQSLVRMFGRSADEVDAIISARRDIEIVAGKEIQILQQGAELRMGILFVFQILTLALSLYFVHQSLLSIAAIIFIITYLGRVTSTMFGINAVVRQLEQGFLDAAKVTEILDIAPEIVDTADAKPLVVTKGTIALRDVSFSYAENKRKGVFTNLHLTIPHGQSIGLVGRSGGGKSTLTNLLLRYMDINAGEITIDGQNIASVTQTSLRSAISYVPQDPFLFHRSLRDNIAYGKPDATDEEIVTAAKQAHAMEFIETLPQGLDTIVGERGVKLSGGQRQRIAIARAILKDAPILLLDEATSALDSESEQLIQNALEKLMRNRTSVVIAHRLSTIAKLDRIIVLDNGEIVEDGNHKALLEGGGTYASLWNHQSGGFIEE